MYVLYIQAIYVPDNMLPIYLNLECLPNSNSPQHFFRHVLCCFWLTEPLLAWLVNLKIEKPAANEGMECLTSTSAKPFQQPSQAEIFHLYEKIKTAVSLQMFRPYNSNCLLDGCQAPPNPKCGPNSGAWALISKFEPLSHHWLGLLLPKPYTG